MSPEIGRGILAGLIIAAAQATLSVGLLKWGWHRRSFYTIWGLTTLARFLVLGLTAFLVHRYTSLNLAATLITMVMATMLIMLIEVGVFLTPKK